MGTESLCLIDMGQKNFSYLVIRGSFEIIRGKKGEAPFEFFKPGSFAIDREKGSIGDI